MQLVKRILPAACLCLAAAPAQVVTNPDFDRVAKHLDLGGETFRFQTAREFWSMVDRAFDMNAGLLALEPEDDAVTQRSNEAVRRAIGDAGLRDLKAYGSSRVRLRNGLARTRRFFYRGDEPAEGMLWNILPRGNPGASRLAGFPKETEFLVQGGVALKPFLAWAGNLWEGVTDEELDGELKDLLALDWDRTADGLRAWSFGLVIDERDAKRGRLRPDLIVHAVVANPYLFERTLVELRRKTPELREERIGAARAIRFPRREDGVRWMCVLDGDNLVWASTGELALGFFENLANPGAGLTARPAFAELADLPVEDSAMLFFWGPNLSRGVREGLLEVEEIDGVPAPAEDRQFQALAAKYLFPEAGAEMSQLTLVQHQPDGILMASRRRGGRLLPKVDGLVAGLGVTAGISTATAFLAPLIVSAWPFEIPDEPLWAPGGAGGAGGPDRLRFPRRERKDLRTAMETGELLFQAVAKDAKGAGKVGWPSVAQGYGSSADYLRALRKEQIIRDDPGRFAVIGGETAESWMRLRGQHTDWCFVKGAMAVGDPRVPFAFTRNFQLSSFGEFNWVNRFAANDPYDKRVVVVFCDGKARVIDAAGVARMQTYFHDKGYRLTVLRP